MSGPQSTPEQSTSKLLAGHRSRRGLDKWHFGLPAHSRKSHNRKYSRRCKGEGKLFSSYTDGASGTIREALFFVTNVRVSLVLLVVGLVILYRIRLSMSPIILRHAGVEWLSRANSSRVQETPRAAGVLGWRHGASMLRGEDTGIAEDFSGEQRESRGEDVPATRLPEGLAPKTTSPGTRVVDGDVGTGDGRKEDVDGGGLDDHGGFGSDEETLEFLGDDVFAPPLPSVLLGIPTVPRREGVNYLEKTIQAVLPLVEDKDPMDPPRSSIMVMIVNMHGPGYTAFNEARRKYGNIAAGLKFLSVEDNNVDGFGVYVDSTKEAHPLQMSTIRRLPTSKVKKQTRDLAYLLRLAAGRADHFVFAEDDMRLCAAGLNAVTRIVDKAHSYHPDWIAIRASFGMNGIFMQARDILPFADYLEVHQHRRPPDHLVVEWFAGEIEESRAYKGDRPHLSFRYNIFEHLGKVSTLRNSKSPTYPACFEELTFPTLFKVEEFDMDKCEDDDLSPCDVLPSSKAGFPKVNWPEVNRRKDMSRSLG